MGQGWLVAAYKVGSCYLSLVSLLPDALGSVRQWTDDAGNVTYAAAYTPYGETLWQQDSTQSAWGYTGEWWDADVGLEYPRARWYSPQVGIFSSPDPFPGLQTQPLSFNPYLYALANPINYVDPTGTQPTEAILGWLRDKAEACYEAGWLNSRRSQEWGDEGACGH